MSIYFISSTLIILIMQHVVLIEARPQVCTKFVVTGATGALGSSLCHHIVDQSIESTSTTDLLLGYRSESRLRQTLVQLQQRMEGKESQEKVKITPFYCDLTTGTRIEKTMMDLNIKMCSVPVGSSVDVHEHIILVNNAANCLRSSSPQVLRQSLDVNAIFPYQLARSVLLHADCNQETTVTIVNISSQDGELSRLHSDLAEHIRRLNSQKEWENFVNRERDAWRGSDFEYAFGETPLYSFSKAVFTTATKILSRDVAGREGRRVVAMCPGNVLSQMSTEEEKTSAVSPVTASELVLRVASDETGQYRNGEFCRVNDKNMIECDKL